MVTIKEVAQRANVSVTTVSRVLNKRGYISADMYKKVHDAMKELDYQPNEIARSLVKRRSKLIGVLIPSIESPFFGRVMEELIRITSEKGYKILLYCSRNKTDSAHDYVKMLKANQVDGIILGMHSPKIEEGLDRDMPIVSFERYQINMLPLVVCDNLKGGRLAAEELLACGCTSPVMLGERDIENAPANDRFKGFDEIMQNHGRNTVQMDAIKGDSMSGNYARSAKKLFERYPETDGVFCTSDHMAAYVIQEVSRLGRSVPDDVNVIGFNDDSMAEMTTPPLTSIHQPIRDMCESAMDILMRKMEGEPIGDCMMFPVELVRRGSTRQKTQE